MMAPTKEVCASEARTVGQFVLFRTVDSRFSQ